MIEKLIFMWNHIICIIPPYSIVDRTSEMYAVFLHSRGQYLKFQDVSIC
jgi:hypothetical protein